MSLVRMPRLSRLPVMAVELTIGSAIVLVHLVIASHVDRQRASGLPGRSVKTPPAE